MCWSAVQSDPMLQLISREIGFNAQCCWPVCLPLVGLQGLRTGRHHFMGVRSGDGGDCREACEGVICFERGLVTLYHYCPSNSCPATA